MLNKIILLIGLFSFFSIHLKAQKDIYPNMYNEEVVWGGIVQVNCLGGHEKEPTIPESQEFIQRMMDNNDTMISPIDIKDTLSIDDLMYFKKKQSSNIVSEVYNPNANQYEQDTIVKYIDYLNCFIKLGQEWYCNDSLDKLQINITDEFLCENLYDPNDKYFANVPVVRLPLKSKGLFELNPPKETSHHWEINYEVEFNDDHATRDYKTYDNQSLYHYLRESS